MMHYSKVYRGLKPAVYSDFSDVVGLVWNFKCCVISVGVTVRDAYLVVKEVRVLVSFF